MVHLYLIPENEKLLPFDNSFLLALTQPQYHEKHVKQDAELLCNPGNKIKDKYDSS